MTTIKITELTDIGANLASSTVLPVVNMAGTPTTEKTILGNIANVVLAGAGGNYVAAAKATIANTVTTNAQPNITSVGTLTNLSVTGNITANSNITANGTAYLGNISTTGSASITTLTVGSTANLGNVGNVTITGGTSGQFLSTDGNGILSWATANGGGGNPFNQDLNTTDNVTFANVTSTEAVKFSNSGNLVGAVGYSANYVSIESYGSNNVNITANDVYTWTFDNSGNLELPGNIVGPAGANLVIYANAGVHDFTFGDDGTFYAPDNVVLSGTRISMGPGAANLQTLTNAVFIASTTGDAYIQAVIENVSDNGSADWVALGHRGDDDGGWADMGFTSSGFNDANYTITGPGDGYVFAQTYMPGTIITGDKGGNLVLATGENGTVNDIIFGTGGFLIGNIFGRISDANNAFELSRAGASLRFPDGTVITDDLEGTGNFGVTTPANVGFMLDTNAGTHTWVFGSDGDLSVPDTTSIIANVEITLVANSTGNISGLNVNGDANANLYAHSNVTIVTDSSNTTPTWNFDNTGNLTLPTISLGSGLDEQTIVASQRKIIPPYRYSVVIDGATPTVVYFAAAGSLTLKTTIVVQHQGAGLEMFDVSAVAAGANVIYSVSNRLNATGGPDTTAVVDYSGPVLAITLTVNTGATTSWVTYDSTEFGIPVD